MDLKERIKFYREKRNISKSELARQINVSPSYITMLENGDKKNPSMEILLKIAKAFNISYSELIKDTNIEFEDLLISLDNNRDGIEAKQRKSNAEYNKLYTKIENLLNDYDYVLESDEQYNSIDEELITIIKNEEKILTIRKSILISSGEEVLNLIESFKEISTLGLIEKLKNTY